VTSANPSDAPPLRDDAIADEAVRRVARWLEAAERAETDDDRAATGRLHELIEDADGVAFTMQFVDRVIRPDDNGVAAHQLHELVTRGGSLPTFLHRADRLLLRAGARLAPRLPSIVMPLARRRMRQIVGHLVVDAGSEALPEHLARRRADGFDLNVNLLGEAVLGEREAARRLEATKALLREPDIDYVSVKISSVASQLNHWAWDDSVDRISERLRDVLVAARERGTFVNLDMEEYHDLELTIEAFCRVLDEPELFDIDAGIVLQAYLPDSFDALHNLVSWATARRDRGGAGIKIRLVKGANLAMERVDAAMHGWQQAPYPTKADTDANFKRCIDWAFTPERTAAVRYGIGSHNLFDIAFARLVAEQRGVSGQVSIEMLEGMAPAQARTIRDEAGRLLLYTPVVDPADFDVAISYLFRRLEENAAPGNFLHSLTSLQPGSDAFATQEAAFRAAVARRWEVATGSRRTVDRTTRAPSRPGTGDFGNDPETDPTIAVNRRWVIDALRRTTGPPETAVEGSIELVDHRIRVARAGQRAWSALPLGERQRILFAVGDELDRRRSDLVSAMAHEGRKTFAQADPEICEAIDFARYYASCVPGLDAPGTVFEPYGVVAVIPPWNFPVAIPASGVLASLAAGNGVLLKPAPETPRCAEIVAECCWAAGVPGDVLQFVRVPEDEAGRHLVSEVDAIILTGSTETADLFRSWKPDLRLFAETSGKNAIVITPNADLDLAVRDLVASAFGHAGQKCSAASLAICVGDVHRSPRFRRQLRDAVESLAVGESTDITTTMNGLIAPPGDALRRGLTRLDDGEEWLVEPRRIGEDDRLWSPGVRWGVQPGSWYHRTECFGPVLGVIQADDLDEAIAIQNSSAFGLTGGIHSLDPDEIDRWVDTVQVGNAYVNRGITGAIVRRQPFGGWKRSSVGPGAKAGGPNYVRQLGRWDDAGTRDDDPAAWLAAARADDERTWNEEFGIDHDPTDLFCERNTFRYRPMPSMALRMGPGVPAHHVERVRAAARCCGVPLTESSAEDESEEAFAARLPDLDVGRIRILGPVGGGLRRAANDAHVHLADDPVTAIGRVELPLYLREQAVTETTHRFGNLVVRR
jgi:RHH-type proline utilization regulon transcriptional repressor/proline dehydrogenase/delta 1-pyrroline-5-carboxylate dehydrogenase